MRNSWNPFTHDIEKNVLNILRTYLNHTVSCNTSVTDAGSSILVLSPPFPVFNDDRQVWGGREIKGRRKDKWELRLSTVKRRGFHQEQEQSQEPNVNMNFLHQFVQLLPFLRLNTQAFLTHYWTKRSSKNTCRVWMNEFRLMEKMALWCIYN